MARDTAFRRSATEPEIIRLTTMLYTRPPLSSGDFNELLVPRSSQQRGVGLPVLSQTSVVVPVGSRSDIAFIQEHQTEAER